MRFCGIVLCTVFMWVGTIALSQPVSRHTALNHYVVFANESIHALTVIHKELEAFQWDALAWHRDTTGLVPVYAVHNQLHRFSYFGWRQGVCTRVPGITDPVENIRALYERTKQESGFISDRQRARLNQFRDELMFILIQTLDLSDSLELRLKKTGLNRRTDLHPVFEILNNLELLFHDFQAMRDKLEFTLLEAAGPAPPELQHLTQLVFRAQQLLQGLRHESEEIPESAFVELSHAIETARANQLLQIEKMRRMDLYHHRDLTGYRYLIEYGERLLQTCRKCLSAYQEDPVVQAYGIRYFCYNERLLPLYNHFDNGMVAYFNSFVRFANTHLMQRVEEVPWFRAAQLPKYKRPETIIPDSESLEAQAEPIIHRNHLVFLLDISASMNKPEKLPLLKSALLDLLPLLDPDDKISIISYSGAARLIQPPVSASRMDEIEGAISRLQASGKTHLKQGIRIAYQTAETHFVPGGNNRIILATDGAFPFRESLLRKVARKQERSIPLSVFFLGKKITPRSSEQLQELAKAGGGNFAHIVSETVKEALNAEVRALNP